MATVMVRVDPATKELWVEAAYQERLSLSEWVRRRCDLGAGEPEAAGERSSVSAVARETGAAQTSRVSPEPAVKEQASPAPSSRRCVREARHHINHSGRPCDVCGYPVKEGAVT